MALDKNAKELIEKLAGSSPDIKSRLKPLLEGAKKTVNQGGTAVAKKMREFDGTHAAVFGAGALAGGVVGRSSADTKEDREKKSSMKNLIDDIIKGAEQNSFGRPVRIQNATQDWTHLDTAKTAGALQLLAEQGYSVKEAAEFLDVSEELVRAVIAAVG